jgi:hypothetical protein
MLNCDSLHSSDVIDYIHCAKPEPRTRQPGPITNVSYEDTSNPNERGAF